jgi:DNA-binding transcriptional LysR family regulator
VANLSIFDLNLLRVLDALLREHSTVKAGERLGLSQPAVSGALGRLRAALNDQLFFRSGQKLAPTEFALALETPLREILTRVEELIQNPADFDPAQAVNRFRISGSDFFAEMLMPNLAERLGALAPSISVHLVDLVPDNRVEALQRYEVDFALIPDTPLPDWAEGQSMFRSSFSIIARKAHPDLVDARIASGAIMPLDLFCELGHVLFSPEGKPSGMADHALARVGRERRVKMTLPVFSGVYRAVAGSDLIALLPTALAHRVAASVGLDVFQPPIAMDPAHLVLIWHRRYSASPAHVWLRGQIADLLQPYDASA